MANVRPPDITPRTGLWGLGFRMESVAITFSNTADDIRGIWSIGKALAIPFDYLSALFYSARDKCWESDQSLVKAMNWVNALTEGSIVLEILERVWHEFTFLRYDPIGWVRQKIDEISVELQFLRNDPYGWIRSRLFGAFPAMRNMLENSGGWIYNELGNRYPVIRDFIVNPWGFVYNKVLGLFSWARSLDSNPLHYVINLINNQTGWFWEFINNPSAFIIGRIKQENYDLYTLFTHPRDWFITKMAELFGMTYVELRDFVPSLIRRMFSIVLSNQAGLLDYTKDAMINLLLRFI